MATHKLLLLPGDGIGPEVMAEVKRLIDWLDAQGIAHFETEQGLVGGSAYDASQQSITDATMAQATAADAVIFPSEWDEPFGLVPIEAMACGTPVIATGVGGSGEFLVDGANCLRFKAGDPASLAEAVRRLAGDPALRSDLVSGGLRTASWFDIDFLADHIDTWIDALIEPSTHPDPPSRRFAASALGSKGA